MQDLDIEEKFLMQHIKELYEYREMIISLVRKDLRGRYKGSVLGFLWTFVNPLLQLIVRLLYDLRVPSPWLRCGTSREWGTAREFQ